MKFYADIHLHSHFSRATSKQLNLEHLSKWAQLKGITVVGTGDFVHPAWLAELRDKLEPAEPGLFRLKQEFAQTTQIEVPKACEAPVRFMLTVEISNIYKRLDKVRKIHNVVFVPSFEAAARLQSRLEAIGNIRSDGRPILGLDSRDLLEIVLETDSLSFLVPAHIWTPWFSVLGSKGGFDAIDDCFADLTPHVFAVETGLSSDPPMNWRLTQLDRFVLISNSDAHSPPKLAREANLFDTELSYPAIRRAWKEPEDRGFLGTIEFFPEEGKYHYDGHRQCKVRLHPRATSEHGGKCPSCGKPVTVGVMARVEELADCEDGRKSPRWRPYTNLIPLPEVIGEAKGKGPNTKTVGEVFDRMLQQLGNELYLLQAAPLEELERVGGPVVAEGIRRMRTGEVAIAAGYDGAYGVIRIFAPHELATLQRQTSLVELEFSPGNGATTHASMPGSEDAEKPASTSTVSNGAHAPADAAPVPSGALNASQQQAVNHRGSHLLIVAGPGTGKTHTLIHRMRALLEAGEPAREFLAITFTNKAARELQQRLEAHGGASARQVTVGTFHAFCLSLLREHAVELQDFEIIDDEQRLALAATLWPESSPHDRKSRLEAIAFAKSQDSVVSDSALASELHGYNEALRSQRQLDFDDLIIETTSLLRTAPAVCKAVHARYRWIFVDEYQDLNPAQHALLKELVHAHAGLTAIGDPNQAIYGFRGSDAGYFARFAEDFPGATELRLEENYRSSANILSASGQVIERGTHSLPLTLTPTLLSEGRVTIYAAPTDRAEAEYVVHQIEKLVGGTSMFSQDSGRVEHEREGERSFGDIAVLYRLNALRAPLVEAFERSGMPYQIAGDASLIAKTGVAELMAVLRALAGMPYSAERLSKWVQRMTPGFGDRAATKAAESLARAQPFQLDHLLQLADKKEFKASAGALRTLRDLLEQFVKAQQVEGFSEALEQFLQQPLVSDAVNADQRVQANWERVVRLAREARSLNRLVDLLALQRETDHYDKRAESVALMTLHAAKGLEFPVVFIVGCEANLLPLQLSGMQSDPEEERRLFYVGMTRSQETLFLLRVKRRRLFGQTLRHQPSPFLSDIKEQLKAYEYWLAPARKPVDKISENQLELF